jgi:acetyltransferase-like isoleucine patch superfamily enzyme
MSAASLRARLPAPVRSIVRGLLLVSLPTPWPACAFYRGADAALALMRRVASRLLTLLWREPAFRCRCVRVGRRLRLAARPGILGFVRITVGDDVSISGPLGIVGATGFDAELVVGDRVFIGHEVSIHVARSVVIEDDAGIAPRCYLADNDNHARDPAEPDEVKPVRVGRGAWIGRGSIVLKGVTVGEGAIVAAGSLVVADVPPRTLAMGNPARVVARLPQ